MKKMLASWGKFSLMTSWPASASNELRLRKLSMVFHLGKYNVAMNPESHAEYDTNHLLDEARHNKYQKLVGTYICLVLISRYCVIAKPILCVSKIKLAKSSCKNIWLLAQSSWP